MNDPTTWTAAAKELTAHAQERSDLDPWTVQELERHLERIAQGRTYSSSGAPTPKDSS